jgi:DNA repair protein RadC
MRERVLDKGAETLADYELLEVLLYSAVPRKDTKALAKALLKRFGSLGGVMTAPAKDLGELRHVKGVATTLFRTVREVGVRLAREEVAQRDVLSSWDRLLDYCRVRLAHTGVEEFHLLFLDRKNGLIADEAQQRGTIDHTPVYPREVVKRALELGASAIIMVHNHPSGDPTPSSADVAMTREVAAAAEKLGIAVHDHVVIGRTGHASFRSLGLL